MTEEPGVLRGSSAAADRCRNAGWLTRRCPRPGPSRRDLLLRAARFHATWPTMPPNSSPWAGAATAPSTACPSRTRPTFTAKLSRPAANSRCLERVDKPECVHGFGHAAGCHFLLGDNREVGRFPQPRDDHCLRRVIRRGQETRPPLRSRRIRRDAPKDDRGRAKREYRLRVQEERRRHAAGHSREGIGHNASRSHPVGAGASRPSLLCCSIAPIRLRVSGPAGVRPEHPRSADREHVP